MQRLVVINYLVLFFACALLHELGHVVVAYAVGESYPNLSRKSPKPLGYHLFLLNTLGLISHLLPLVF